MAIALCCFTAGIDEMKRKHQADTALVLETLRQSKRFSVYEATANPVIAKTMTRIWRDELVKDMGGEFPWTRVELTDKGRAYLASTVDRTEEK